MAKACYKKVSGVWREANYVYRKVGGVWTVGVIPWIKVAGVWRDCHYGLTSVVCNSIPDIAAGSEGNALPSKINYTNSGVAGTAIVNWKVVDNDTSLMVDSGDFGATFPNGTANMNITGILYPAAGFYTFQAKMSTEASYKSSSVFISA